MNVHFVKKQGGRMFRHRLIFAASFFVFAQASGLLAADLDHAQSLFQKGDYTACINEAQSAVDSSSTGWDEQWPLLLARAQMAVGKYPEAQATIVRALRNFPNSIQLMLGAYYVFNANGHTDRARGELDHLAALLEQLNTSAGARLRSMLDPPSIVALGQAQLLMNQEPKLVLNIFFDQVKSIAPDTREAWLATGELALQKHDYQLAATNFSAALQHFPDDPDAEFGLARAYAPSDIKRMGTNLQLVLNQNPNHVPAMRLLVDHLVDAEQYDDAGKMLDDIFKVNPWDPEAWAYRAVIAHLKNDTNAESSARDNALKFWTTNPRVDQLIGEKLSQNYRFREGAEHQRQALEFDPEYLPAKIQLAQDLLRLGEETEGWNLAREVHDADRYDITAFNLNALRQQMAKFKTITNQDFIVRMAANEAPLYGDQVLELLQRAKDTVTKKYGMQLDQPTYVEIFSQQKDFGVRTFGMPLNPGFLGVCFGHVITANSPAAQENPENWEDVLWHEFCHVVTLNITRNKMPRWLSEGISVYEERQASPVWGMKMNPRFREMVLGGDLTPIADLSSAFMTPKSPYHVQFAYYESSLVVEYIVQKFGFDALKQILTDLGDGVNINDAIARHTEPMPQLEKDFAAFATDRANSLAPGLDWQKPGDTTAQTAAAPAASSSGSNGSDTDVITRLMHRRTEEIAGTNAATAPSEPAANSAPNYWRLLVEAETALQDRQWAEAKAPLETLIKLYPAQTGSDSAYALLAGVHRELNETNEERQSLITLAALDSDNTEAYARLMEMDDARGDWGGVAENAERFLAVNPLLPLPYRELARASEQLNHDAPAIRSYQRLLLLDPPDPAEVHYRLARLLHKTGDAGGAKRNVLQALEEAPRFPDALRLLLEIEGPTEALNTSPPAAAKSP
ncbi:MAG TPA: tetratricopeptide repeat protein [Verrucomicrobiae bacterium]|nr:tetratricopeptide repeat protein [Verrucomicrobiae bacterium]